MMKPKRKKKLITYLKKKKTKRKDSILHYLLKYEKL